jgi:hypothetical protein
MTLDEIRGVLAEAMAMRTPRKFTEQAPKERVGALEDYLLESAYQRGALIEARHWLRELEDRLRQEADELQGWQAMLAGSATKVRTKAEIQAAKETAAPALFAAGREARKLRGSVDDQIDRFAFEDQFVISRAYSMISGS